MKARRNNNRDIERGLQELDKLLVTMLSNAFLHTTLLADQLRSVLLSQVKRTTHRENLLRALAALNDLGVRRTKQQAVMVAEEVVAFVPKGVIEDCLAEFLRLGQPYLELIRKWEYQSLRAVDETFWKKMSPESVFLTEEEAMEISEKLMELERKFGSNRKFLATTLRNIRQCYSLYTARRNFLLQKSVRLALYFLRSSISSTTKRLEVAGIALLYAYRSWCRELSSTFFSIVRVKVLEVLRRLDKLDVPLLKSFLVPVKSRGNEKSTVSEVDVSGTEPALEDVEVVPVEALPDECSLQPIEERLERGYTELWKHERLLEYCSRLSVPDKQLLAYGFGYTDPLYFEALVDADRDWLPELLRQYIAKFHYSKDRSH